MRKSSQILSLMGFARNDRPLGYLWAHWNIIRTEEASGAWLLPFLFHNNYSPNA
jgi:hypothetical protein